MGDGPVDLLAFTNGNNVWIDRDGEPHWSRFDSRLASFSRLIRYDPVGIGLSDPLSGGAVPELDGWMDDALAVLDALGSSRAALFGVGTGALVPILLAATHPDRVAALVLMHAWARLARADDYPCGVPQALFERFIDAVTNPSYEGEGIDDVMLSAPSLAGNEQFRAWWKRAGERSASPAVARSIDLVALNADLRRVLPMITAPTLVLHRVDNRFVAVGHGRYLAEHIPGARLVELTGADSVPFGGDTEPVLGEIEEFLTGSRLAVDIDRALATVLFSDIVDSTRQASARGDRQWRVLLDHHDEMAHRQVERFGGRVVKSTGDGILATFDGPARAIQCGLALCDAARQLGSEVRVGVHTGEVELRGDDVAGLTVHIAARVEAHAEPGEVWVSRTVADLLAGSHTQFTERGEHTLKGVPGRWQLFAVHG
jgi:class 3 adenylate cyclase